MLPTLPLGPGSSFGPPRCLLPPNGIPGSCKRATSVWFWTQRSPVIDIPFGPFPVCLEPQPRRRTLNFPPKTTS